MKRKQIVLSPGGFLTAGDSETYKVTVAYSEHLEVVQSDVVQIERVETGNYWLLQSNGVITEIPQDKYLYLQIEVVAINE